MKYAFSLFSLTAALCGYLTSVNKVAAQGTAFTYNGRLTDGGQAANGRYDLRFIIYNADIGGSQVGTILTNTATGVANGLFTVTLDFGAGIFTGPDRWAEIAARTNGGGAFTTLSPRQQLTPTPYAIMANSASNLLGTVADTRLSANVALLNANQTFSGPNTFGNANSSFTGSGAGLTSLNASNLTAGTVADARLSANVALKNGSQTFSGTNAFTNPSNTFVGTFAGNGGGISNVAATNLTGAITDARLSTNVALLNAASQTFTGTMSFGAQPRQMLELYRDPTSTYIYGLGVQSSLFTKGPAPMAAVLPGMRAVCTLPDSGMPAAARP
jgi:hypothetical protein